MGFSQLERIQLAAKTLASAVKDSDVDSQWYESTEGSTFTLPSQQVWTQADLLRANPAPGPGPGAAQALAAGALIGVVEDRSTVAVRLTPVSSVDNTYIALSTYGDFSSSRLDNWISPHFVPLTNGAPSTSYAVRLYNGTPSPATEVLTTDGSSGTGASRSPGWAFDYAAGMLLLSEDFPSLFLTQTGNTWVNDPHILGFRYVGTTAGSGSGGSITETVDCILVDASGEVVTNDGNVLADTSVC